MVAETVPAGSPGERPVLLHDMVSTGAARHPDRPALVVDDQATTYAELERRTTLLAAALRRIAGPGERVAFVADNGPEWIDAYYGVPRAGWLLGFVNQRLGPQPLRAAVARLRPRVLVGGREQLDLLRETGPLDDLAPLVVAVDRPAPGEAAYADLLAAGAAPGAREPAVGAGGTGHPRPGPDDTAWLLATSGTSGTPKVVELSHRNILAAVTTTLAVRPVADDDVYLFPFPLCHVAGYNVLLFHHSGRPVVLARRFDPAAVAVQVDRHRVTTISLAPTMLHGLLDHLDRHGGALAPLRTVSYGSSAISPHLLARAIDRLGVDFNQGYGMTELAGNAVFLSPEDHRQGMAGRPSLLRAAGRPGPGVSVRLLDDDGAEVPVSRPGEVAIRAPQVTKGYWEAPDANAAAFHDGWFRTGDVGRIGPDGYLSIVDRKKDIIVSGGENVSSREVEDALATHPDVAEVAVVGAADPRWGEVVCAVVVPRAGSGLTGEEVLRFGRERIGGFQQPRQVEVVDQLPRNGTGKVLKHELRALVANPGRPRVDRPAAGG